MILAGITIASISGSDSAPEKATAASQKNDIGAAKDDVNLSVTSATTDAYQKKYLEPGGITGGIGTEVIKSVAQKYQSDNQIGKAKVEIKGFGTLANVTKDATVLISTTDFKITGTIFKSDGHIVWGDIGENVPGSDEDLTEEEIANRINSAIGQVVNYSANGLDSWRVFYADKNTQEMFIIPTKSADNECLININKSGKYTNSEDVFMARNPASGTSYTYSNVLYGLTYNSKWAEALKGNGTTRTLDVDNYSNPTTRSKMTAYLCDPTNWVSYISSNAPSGTYAVGAPTLELLADSWERIGNNANWQNDDVESGGYVGGRPTGLYTGSPILANIKEVEIEENSTTKKYGLYNNGTSYWLASPTAGGGDRYSLCIVDNSWGDGKIYSSYSGSAAHAIRPIVSIPFSGVEIEENVKQDNTKEYVVSIK